MASPLDPAIEALRAHAPTSRHAEMLFDLLVDVLGDQGVVTTMNDKTLLMLFRRDATRHDLIVPWPIARLSVRGRIGWVSPAFDTTTGEMVPEPERPPGKASRLRGLGPAQIDLLDGTAKVSLVYGDDGSWKEASLDDRTPSRLGEIPAALASKRTQPVELIAWCVAMFDSGRHGPGRILMPVRVPGGPECVWQTGLHAARRALYSGKVPPKTRYLVVDGIAGTVLGAGVDLEEATTAFEARFTKSPPRRKREMRTAWDDYDDDGNLLRRGKPLREGEPPPWETDDPWEPPGSRQPEPDREPGVVEIGDGMMRFTGPKSDDPLPEIALDTVPLVVIPLDGSPTVPPPLGSWERTLGAMGATAHLARLTSPGGFVQVGEGIVWRADPLTLSQALDEADARDGGPYDAMAEANPLARFWRFRARAYRWAEARDVVPARFEISGGTAGPRYDGTDLDGDRESFLVRRHMKIPRGAA